MKPSVVVAETVENGVEGVTILTNGKREPFFFKSLEGFSEHVETLENCTVLLNSSVLKIKSNSLETILASLNTDDLRKIVDDKTETGEIATMLYTGVLKEITV